MILALSGFPADNELIPNLALILHKNCKQIQPPCFFLEFFYIDPRVLEDAFVMAKTLTDPIPWTTQKDLA